MDNFSKLEKTVVYLCNEPDLKNKNLAILILIPNENEGFDLIKIYNI
jgi:hypothetical protein